MSSTAIRMKLAVIDAAFHFAPAGSTGFWLTICVARSDVRTSCREAPTADCRLNEDMAAVRRVGISIRDFSGHDLFWQAFGAKRCRRRAWSRRAGRWMVSMSQKELASGEMLRGMHRSQPRWALRRPHQ